MTKHQQGWCKEVATHHEYNRVGGSSVPEWNCQNYLSQSGLYHWVLPTVNTKIVISSFNLVLITIQGECKCFLYSENKQLITLILFAKINHFYWRSNLTPLPKEVLFFNPSRSYWYIPWQLLEMLQEWNHLLQKKEVHRRSEIRLDGERS